MPLYYFNLDDGVGTPDAEGLELPGLRQAQAEAVLLLSELLRARPEDSWAGRAARLSVTDQTGAVLLRIEVSAPAKAAE